MNYSNFNETMFRAQIDRALTRVSQILETTKHPQYAADISHNYEDKYLLVEFLTNTSLAAYLNCLAKYGVTAEHLKTIHYWISMHRSVTMGFRATEKCKFVREEEREVESPSVVTEEKVNNRITKSVTNKVVSKVKEYHWLFDVTYDLVVYWGCQEECIAIRSRSCQHEVKTASDKNPFVESRVCPILEVDITWLFSNMDHQNNQLIFCIDRHHKDCKTPSRNPSTESALKFVTSLSVWSKKIVDYVMWIFSINKNLSYDMSSVSATSCFIPVAPFLIEKNSSISSTFQLENLCGEESLLELSVVARDVGAAELSTVGMLLGISDCNLLLGEQEKSLQQHCTALSQSFAAVDTGSLVTVAEAEIALLSIYVILLARQYADSVAYVEHMLRSQLVAAIGREVSSKDFNEYMKYHCRRVLLEPFTPKPFSYAVRRSDDHAPEGSVSIEDAGLLVEGGVAECIYTVVRRAVVLRGASHGVLEIPIDASTTVRLTGHRYVHAWLSQKFGVDSQSTASQSTTSSLVLSLRARQFSSFIVLLGRMGAEHTFLPKYGIIVQNKDDLSIPLDLTQIPSHKEFKDAISSLSPEQQRFAKAYRSMQLEGTLFGVCVVQVKPQLEMLLGLPEDSLTKEIQLTQDLTELFVKYQIPSDLLSYDGPVDVSVMEKLDCVRKHVSSIHKMIALSKEKELEERKMEAEYANPKPVQNVFADEHFASLACADEGYGGMSVPRAPTRMAKAKGAFGTFAMNSMPMSSHSNRSMYPTGSSNDVMFLSAAQDMVPCSAPPSLSSVSPSMSTGNIETTVSTSDPNQSDVNTDHLTHLTGGGDVCVDEYSKLPAELDRRLGQLDVDAAVRPTILTPSDTWTRRAQKAILAAVTTSMLSPSDQKQEKERTFELLDALSRSGALPIHHASVHIVLAATHCFDRSIMDTIVQDNVNPIEKMERSLLIMATTVHQRTASEMVKPHYLEQLRLYSPMLLTSDGEKV